MEVRVLLGAKLMKANFYFFICLFLIFLLFILQPQRTSLGRFKVLSYPELLNNYQRIKVLDLANKEIYTLYLSKDIKLSLGDELILENFYLQNEKIYFPQKIIVKKNKNFFLNLAQKLKEFYDNRIQQNLPWPEENILRGIILGEKIEDYELYQNFQKAGVAHILVASGSNLVLISSIFLLTLRSLKFLNFKIASILLILVLTFYLFLVGFEGSILRAYLFSLFLIIIKNFAGRIPLKRNIIITLVLIFILISPKFFLELGTLLSFLSFLGIIYLAPFLKAKFLNFVKNNFFSEVISQTLSSYIFVFPLVNFYFQSFNIFSPIFNLLILPLLPYVFFLGLFSFLPFFSFLVLPLLYFLKMLVNLASIFPSISISFPVSFYFLYFLVIFYFVYKINKNENIEFNFAFR